MRWPRAVLLALLLPLGCLHEYHPEYSPRSAYTYVQNISYPTTVVYELQAPGASSAVAVEPRVPKHGGRPPPSTQSSPSASAPGAAGARPSIHEREERASALRDDERAPTPVALAWPGPDPAFRDLFAEERAQVLASREARSADAWEKIVGKARPGAGMTDVVVDTSLQDAGDIAARTPLLNVPCMLPGFHAARYGTVVGIRRYPGAGDLAQILLKVDARWDKAWADAQGKEVGVNFDLGARQILGVGHVAGPAAEGMSEALVRAGACRAEENGNLHCSGKRLALLEP